jgi:dienelactone hydrolase
MKKIIRILRKVFLFSFGAVVTIILFTILVFWLEHNSSLTLPKPTGTFAVGRSTFDWIDSSRTDSLAPLVGVKRELIVWIWYPVSGKKLDSAIEYLPMDWRNVISQKEGFIMSSIMTQNLSKVHPHSIANLEFSPKQTKYPIIFLKSGIGALATDYTTLAEDLASHGYVVVGNDSPYSTFVVVFPDGRIIERTVQGSPGGEEDASSVYSIHLANRLVSIWSDDTRFILNKLEQLNTIDSLNRFFGRLDTHTVGIYGHSFGGATSAQFCHDEIRCKAGIDMDGRPFGPVIQTGLKKPFMFLLSGPSGEPDPDVLEIKSEIENIYNSSLKSHVWISLDGAKHFNFSDIALINEKFISRLSGATGSIGNRRGLEVAAGCVRTFFDVYLKNQSTTKIDSLAIQYPEVRIVKSKI